jgi:ApbE superfamily uncharacterized protein (UPF0280 family)
MQNVKYQERIYRDWIRAEDLVGFRAVVKETDLFILAERDLSNEAIDSIIEFRTLIEEYIRKDPGFHTALTPYPVNGEAPPIIRDMAKASSLAGVGPFASVAGAIAQYAGKRLLKYSPEIIVENGGDIFIKSSKNRIVGIYAGNSSFNKKIGLEIEAGDTPVGICTSSGTIGHSLSFGKADAAVVLSGSALLADAAATAIGNIVKKDGDIPEGIRFARTLKGLSGVVIIKDDKIGVWGKVKISRL